MDQFLMQRATLDTLTPEQVGNANTIVPRVNQLLDAFGEYRNCNSGFRTQEDQMRINPKAPNSAHTKACAIDLEDKDRALTHFCLNNLPVLEKIGLWMESPDATPTWTHLQCYAPKSGNRVFIP